MDEATTSVAAPSQAAANADKKVLLAQWEALSKEELLKLAKKQLNFLKKFKEKSDELSKKCTALEKEKVSIEVHSKELVASNNVLSLEIQNLKAEMDKLTQDNKKLAVVKQEKSKYHLALNESEQQVECLKMKLESLNAANQCLQQDTNKTEKTIADLKSEIQILTEARDATLRALKDQKSHSEKQNGEINELYVVLEDLKKMYSGCKEESELKAARVVQLEAEIVDLKTSLEKSNEECSKEKLQSDAPDISELFQEMCKLQACLSDLRDENDTLIAKNKELQSGGTNIISNDKILDLEKQTVELQKCLCEVEGKNSMLSDLKEKLEIQNSTLLVEVHNALETYEKNKLELDQSKNEIEILRTNNDRLKVELDKERSSLHVGLDQALLHGGYADSVFLHSQNVKLNEKETCTDDLKKEHDTIQESLHILEDTNKKLISKNIYLETEVTNLTKQVNKMAENLQEYKKKFSKLGFDCDIDDFYDDQEIFIKKSDAEALTMELTQQNEAILNENNSLHNELTETVNKFSDFKIHSEEEKAEMLRKISELESVGDEKYQNLSEEVVSLHSKLEETTRKAEILEFERSSMEKQNAEIEAEYKIKSSELNEFNFKLESLITSIKQGVRQKKVSTCSTTDREWQENISVLKVLFDELSNRINGNVTKIKNLEADFETVIIHKQELEDDLIQAKELNQFLEDENRELREEVEQLKVIIKALQDNVESSSGYFNKVSSGNSISELYSIDEANEMEMKFSPPLAETDLKNFDLINSISNAISDSESCQNDTQTVSISKTPVSRGKDDKEVQTTSMPISVIQSETDSGVTNNSVNDVALLELHDALKRENEYLLSENETLKNDVQSMTVDFDRLKTNLDDKSVLVERIHCEMDVLLTKVEELSGEIQEKDFEIQRLKNINTQIELEKNLCVERRIHVANSLLELKNAKIVLETDVNSLTLFSNDTFFQLTKSISEINTEQDKVFKTLKHLDEKIIHMENVINTTKSHVIRISNNFKEALKAANLKDIPLRTEEDNDIRENNDLPKELLAKSLDGDCQDACFEIYQHIDALDAMKENLLHQMNICVEKYESCKQNESDYAKISAELNSYKTVIVPKLEEAVKDIKLKESSKEQSLDTKIVKETNLGSEDKDSEGLDVLKTKLSDTVLKMNKFKQVALKLKKDLTETKERLKDTEEGKKRLDTQLHSMKQELDKMSSVHCQYIQNYQSLQNEYDKIQDENESQKDVVKQLENNLATLIQDLNFNKQQVTELDSQLKATKQCVDSSYNEKQEMENKYAELGSKVIILESKCLEKNKKICELENTVLKHQKETSLLHEENKNFKQQLDQATKEGNKKTLLDLEIADYDRSITELNNQLQKKDNEIMELQNELKSKCEIIDSMAEEIKSTEMLKDTQEKRALDLKAVLEKTHVELAAIKEQKAELTRNVLALQVQLETTVQQEENCKLQLSEASAEVQHLKSVIETSNENHQRIVRLLESKISAQKEEISFAYKEVENLNREFESYKVRVHSVLKQQKVSNPIVSVESDLQEKLETMNDKLKVQIKDLSEKLRATNFEYEALQEEYENLLKKFNKASENLEKQDRDFQARLEQLNAEKDMLRVAQEELSSKHTFQNEMLVSTYKKQIKIMAEEQKQAISGLQEKLNSVESELSQLQRDQQKSSTATPTPTSQDNPLPFDILMQERQEGEGSESTDVPNVNFRHLSLTTIPTSGFLPFEKLLQSPLEPGTPVSYMSDHDSEKLVSELNLVNKKNDHLSELLNDSESTNLRLTEQVRVLKDEVRRLERNKEREKHAENLEYLKNVLLKFATLQPCSEKAMLVPVLSTMLKLSPVEQQQLKNVAGDIDAADANANSGWGSYLHRWSGLI